jgi:hypothetical protein
MDPLASTLGAVRSLFGYGFRESGDKRVGAGRYVHVVGASGRRYGEGQFRLTCDAREPQRAGIFRNQNTGKTCISVRADLRAGSYSPQTGECE